MTKIIIITFYLERFRVNFLPELSLLFNFLYFLVFYLFVYCLLLFVLWEGSSAQPFIWVPEFGFYILALESKKIETANQNPRWIHQIRLESKWATWILCDILPAFHHSFHSPRGHFGQPGSNLLLVRIICLAWFSVAVLENRWAFWMTRNGSFLIIKNELEWFKSQLGSKT